MEDAECPVAAEITPDRQEIPGTRPIVPPVVPLEEEGLLGVLFTVLRLLVACVRAHQR